MRNKKRGSAWTSEDDAELMQMAAAKKSAVAISARLKRTISSTQRRAAILGVKIRSERERKAYSQAQIASSNQDHAPR